MPPEERTFSSRDLWLLVLAAAMLFLPNMITREVRKGEALYASVATDMVRTGAIWVTSAHGAQQAFYPGYPWLVAVCQQLGLPPEMALRLPAVLCIVVLAGLCGMIGYRRGGPVAGAVAAAVVLCNPATLRSGLRAQSEPLLALLLCAAWMTWYSVGQRRKRWTLAWIGAMLFVIPAAFTAGARAIAFFYLPFVFLRRPVRGRRRLLLPSHLAVLGVTVAVLVFWLRHVPNQIFLPWNELNTMPKVSVSYPVEMILFPLKSLLYLMPWPLLFWPAFCMAYRPLESSPVVFHYLRTIVVSAFVAAWLIPKLSPLVLMPALGPLAIMTGLHAELLVRRHHSHLRRLNLAILTAGAAVAGFGTVAAALHLAGIVRFDGMEPSVVTFNAALLLTMLATAVLALRGSLRLLPVHAHLIVAFMVLASSILALNAVWYSWAGGEQRAAGLALAGKIPTPDFLIAKPATAPEPGAAVAPVAVVPAAPASPAATMPTTPTAAVPATAAPSAPLTYRPLSESIVYRQTVNYYLAACFYLGRPVVRVEDPKTQIPLPIPGPRQVLGDVATEAPPAPRPGSSATDDAHRDAVYALCDSGPPVLPAVEWTALTPPIDLRRSKAVHSQWFPGGMTLLRLYTEAAPLPDKPKPDAAKPTPDAEKSKLDAETPKPEEVQPETVRLYRGVRR